MLSFKEVVSALNFPVSLRANMAKDATNHTVRGIGQQVLREDKNVFIANVSDTYGLFQHGKVLEPVLQALDGMDYDVKDFKLDHEGRRVMVKLLSKQSWLVADNDEVRLTLMLVNSYDRTEALKLMVGAYRVICSNGLVVSHPAFADVNINIKMVHSLANVKALDISQLGNKVAMLYGAMEAQVEAWKQMKNTRFSKSALESLKEKVLLPVIGKRAVEEVAEKALTGKGQDGTLSAWSLYQGFTEVLTGKTEKSKTPVAAEARNMGKTHDFLRALQVWQNENPEQLVTVNA
jgi:hypothetical protein